MKNQERKKKEKVCILKKNKRSGILRAQHKNIQIYKHIKQNKKKEKSS